MPLRALSGDMILDAALDVLDEGGTAAASIPQHRRPGRGRAQRRLHLLPEQAAVLEGVVERILGEVEHDSVIDQARPWRERVESLVLHLRQRVLAHPAAVPLMVARPLHGRNWRGAARRDGR